MKTFACKFVISGAAALGLSLAISRRLVPIALRDRESGFSPPDMRQSVAIERRQISVAGITDSLPWKPLRESVAVNELGAATAWDLNEEEKSLESGSICQALPVASSRMGRPTSPLCASTNRVNRALLLLSRSGVNPGST